MYRCRFKAVLHWSCLFFFLNILFGPFISYDNNALAWGGYGGRQAPVYLYQEILVRYRSEASLADIGKSYETLGLSEVGYSPYSGLRRVRVPLSTNVYSISANLNQNPIVEIAEPNYIRRVNFVPNDPLYQYQWHLNNPMLQQTWDQSVGTNIVVAVFDTGIAYRNGGGFALAPDLAETHFVPGYDFVNDDAYPDDDNRHGTHIAGIIAQSTNNLYGGSGVAPDCILMPVKVLDNSGAGTVSDIVDAVYFAVNNGAQIINMSYGFVTSPSASEEEAINFAVSQGVTVICSAGNESTNEPHYPSSYEAAICVTATRYDHSFADSYSNYGPDVDICAPGGDLSEDINGDEYPDGIYQQTHSGTNYNDFDFYFAEGTSCSSAFVSGVVALILSRAGRPLTPIEIRQILSSTATDFGEPGWDQFYGWGLVNPLAAVQAALTYSTASSFGSRTIPQSINSINPSSAYLYQGSNTLPNANINPVRGLTENSIYQTNTGYFATGQQAGQIAAQFNPQLNNPYAYLTNSLTNSWTSTNINPILNNNLLSSPYPIAPFFVPQSLFAITQQPITANGYTQSLAGSYQIESTTAKPVISPYFSNIWNNPSIYSSIILPLSNILFSGNIFPVWVY